MAPRKNTLKTSPVLSVVISRSTLTLVARPVTRVPAAGPQQIGQRNPMQVARAETAEDPRQRGSGVRLDVHEYDAPGTNGAEDARDDHRDSWVAPVVRIHVPEDDR